MKQTLFAPIVVCLLLLAALSVSCASGGERKLESTQPKLTSAVLFDETGQPDLNLTSNLVVQSESVTLNERLVTVGLSTKDNLRNVYIEFKYDAKTESVKDFEFGNSVAQTDSVVTSAVLNHQGIIPVAVVKIGEGFAVKSSTSKLFSVRLISKPTARNTSTFGQTGLDPIVQDRIVDEASSKITWTSVFRGDAGLNHQIDFSDFGKVGAEYGKTIKDKPKSEPSDCDVKGKVDFADFGVIGSGYNDKITGWKIWTSDKNDIDPSKEEADVTIMLNDSNLTQSDSARGFKSFTYDLTKNPNYVKGTTKYYFIVPLDNDGNPMLSLGNGDTTMFDPTKLYEPLSAWATNGDYEDRIVVHWNPPAGGLTPDGYNVYRATLELGTYTYIGNVSGVSSNNYDDASVPDNGVYWYKVKCFAGKVEGPFSNATWGSKKVQGVLPPELPWATNDSYDKITVNWSAPSKGETPDGYLIFRADLQDGTYSQIGKTDSKIIFTYDDNTADPRSYWYKLKSYKATWPDSAFSVAFEGTRKELLPQPAELVWASNDDYDQVNVHWSAPGSGMKPTGYRVYRADLADGTYTALGDVDATTFDYSDKTAAPKVTYWYKVTTLSGKLESKLAESTAAEGVRKEFLPEPPESAWATNDQTDRVDLNWSAPSAGMTPTGYRIYRADLQGGPFKELGNVDATTFVYSDTTAVPKVTYWYKVTTIADKFESKLDDSVAFEGVRVE